MTLPLLLTRMPMRGRPWNGMPADARGSSRGRTSRTRTPRCSAAARSRACDPATSANPRPRDGPIGWKSIFFFASSMRPMPMMRRFCTGSCIVKNAGVEPGLVAERMQPADLDAPRRPARSAARLPSDRPREVLGLVDEDVLAEHVEQLAVGREHHAHAFALLALRPRNRARDLSLSRGRTARASAGRSPSDRPRACTS